MTVRSQHFGLFFLPDKAAIQDRSALEWQHAQDCRLLGNKAFLFCIVGKR